MRPVPRFKAPAVTGDETAKGHVTIGQPAAMKDATARRREGPLCQPKSLVRGQARPSLGVSALLEIPPELGERVGREARCSFLSRGGLVRRHDPGWESRKEQP